MGVLPEGKLLAGMAVPMMISMLFQALYNVVDSVFVAMLSQDALNAVSLAFPLQTLMIAMARRHGRGHERPRSPGLSARSGRRTPTTPPTLASS